MNEKWYICETLYWYFLSKGSSIQPTGTQMTRLIPKIKFILADRILI